MFTDVEVCTHACVYMCTHKSAQMPRHLRRCKTLCTCTHMCTHTGAHAHANGWHVGTYVNACTHVHTHGVGVPRRMVHEGPQESCLWRSNLSTQRRACLAGGHQLVCCSLLTFRALQADFFLVCCFPRSNHPKRGRGGGKVLQKQDFILYPYSLSIRFSQIP